MAERHDREGDDGLRYAQQRANACDALRDRVDAEPDGTQAEKLGLVNRVVSREKLEAETMALAQKIATRDSFALKFAKASVNETQNAQGWREAMEGAFKNYMLTIPHRIEMGTYGAAAREKNPKDRFGVLNRKS